MNESQFWRVETFASGEIFEGSSTNDELIVTGSAGFRIPHPLVHSKPIDLRKDQPRSLDIHQTHTIDDGILGKTNELCKTIVYGEIINNRTVAIECRRDVHIINNSSQKVAKKDLTRIHIQ